VNTREEDEHCDCQHDASEHSAKLGCFGKAPSGTGWGKFGEECKCWWRGTKAVLMRGEYFEP